MWAAVGSRYASAERPSWFCCSFVLSSQVSLLVVFLGMRRWMCVYFILQEEKRRMKEEIEKRRAEAAEKRQKGEDSVDEEARKPFKCVSPRGSSMKVSYCSLSLSLSLSLSTAVNQTAAQRLLVHRNTLSPWKSNYLPYLVNIMRRTTTWWLCVNAAGVHWSLYVLVLPFVIIFPKVTVSRVIVCTKK